MSDLLPEPALDDDSVREILKAAEQFNTGLFFECHDTLEEIWQGTRGPARALFQGIIQISVGFYHLGNGNVLGGESQLSKGLKNLRSYPDRYLGLEVERLRREVGQWLQNIREGTEPGPAAATQAPRLLWRPPGSTRSAGQ